MEVQQPINNGGGQQQGAMPNNANPQQQYNNGGGVAQDPMNQQSTNQVGADTNMPENPTDTSAMENGGEVEQSDRLILNWGLVFTFFR